MIFDSKTIVQQKAWSTTTQQRQQSIGCGVNVLFLLVQNTNAKNKTKLAMHQQLLRDGKQHLQVIETLWEQLHLLL